MADAEDKALVAQILSSYLSNNNVVPADLPSVIESVKRAFNGGAHPLPTSATVDAAEKRQPAVPVKKSIAPDALTCLCCGKKFKSLKRHLQAEHKLTPDDYRAAFVLTKDYPIVAPAYAAQRSALAKSLGLGRKPGTKAAAATKKAGVRRTTKKAMANT